MSLRIHRRTLLALALAAGIAAPVHAADWSPTRTVRIVVPIIGSTNDVLARLVAPELQKALGQIFIVENKGGAGGTLGANEVAKAPPDGHTLLVGFNGPLAINPTLFKQIPYDSQKDLAPITLAVMASQLLALHPKVPANNLQEFIALAKAGQAHLCVGLARQRLPPHDGDAQVGGRGRHGPRPLQGCRPGAWWICSAGRWTPPSSCPATSRSSCSRERPRSSPPPATKRFGSLPNVPTMIEQGFPGFVATSWIGFLAPGKTPQPIIDRYNTEIVRILNLPDVKAQLEKLEFDIVASTPQQFADWIRDEIPRWGKVIKSTGLKAE